jgi:type I restriction enzyme S subunit
MRPGSIPSEWTERKLKELSPSQSVGVVVNPSSYFDAAGTVPFLVGSNVGENTIEWESARRITEASNQRLIGSRLNAGDLVRLSHIPELTGISVCDLRGG